MSRGLAGWLVVMAVLAAALADVLGIHLRNARLGVGTPSFDTFSADYPNLVYALRAFHEGHGLLWNPLQSCGQPFLASTLVGLFYPVHWLALASGAAAAIPLAAIVHLAIAGVGTFALGREVGLGVVAALTAAVCVELGGVANELAGWLPYSVLGAYAWLPVVVWRAERLVRRPDAGAALWLAAALTMQLLVGYPELVVYAYEIVALRVGWEIATARSVPRGRLIGATLAGLALPVALGAVQLFPMLEFARESVRGGALGSHDLGLGDWTWPVFRRAVVGRMGFGNYAAVLPFALAAAGLLHRSRRLTTFYVVVAALFVALAFDDPIARAYRSLPFGAIFRGPGRFLWVAQLAVAVLAGFGADAILYSGRRVVLVPLAAGAAAFGILGAGLFAREWIALAAVVAVGAWTWAGASSWVASALPVVVAASLLVHGAPFLHLIGDASIFTARAGTFAVLRARLTRQERVLHVGPRADFTFMPKTASIVGVPSTQDYEPQTSRRYADVVLALTRSRGQSLGHVVAAANDLPAVRPLLDVMAVRYVAIEGPRAPAFTLLGPGAVLADPGVDADVRVYVNATAQPRASWVPAVRVEDVRNVLPMLAGKAVDPRRVALVEAPLADGFVGGGEPGGAVDIVRDDAEELEARVEAPRDGVLVLADQLYPGWEATVNGVSATIVRANYAFRLVRVPPGTSTVVFRYRPAGLRWGAATSLAALAAVAVLATRLRGRIG